MPLASIGKGCVAAAVNSTTIEARRFFFSKNPKTLMMVGSLGNCWLYQEKSKVTTSRFFKSQIVLRCARLFATRRQSSIEEIVEKELHMTSPTPCRLMDLGVRPSARLFTKIFSDK